MKSYDLRAESGKYQGLTSYIRRRFHQTEPPIDPSRVSTTNRMYTFAKTATIPSHISQEQLSEVLKIKARNAIGFIPGVTKCEVVEELDPTEGNIFIRKVTFCDGVSCQEKHTVFPPSHVRPRQSKWIKN